jgi:tetratricopeptide (TPR) repeat protein
MAGKKSLLNDPIFQTLITAIAATIARLAKLKAAGAYKEALAEIEAQLEDLIGLNTNQIRYMDDEFIYELLTVNEFLDFQRLWFIAALMDAYGGILTAQGRRQDGRDCRMRALSFFIETALSTDEDIAEVNEKIDEMADELWGSLSEETLFNLYGLYEWRGAYDKALNAIDRLVEISQEAPELVEERQQFLLRRKRDSQHTKDGF